MRPAVLAAMAVLSDVSEDFVVFQRMAPMLSCSFVELPGLANQKKPWPTWKPSQAGATNVTVAIRFATTTAARGAEASLRAGFEEQLINNVTGNPEVLKALVDAGGPGPEGMENRPALRAKVDSTYMLKEFSNAPDLSTFHLTDPSETGDGPYPCSDSASYTDSAGRTCASLQGACGSLDPQVAETELTKESCAKTCGRCVVNRSPRPVKGTLMADAGLLRVAVDAKGVGSMVAAVQNDESLFVAATRSGKLRVFTSNFVEVRRAADCLRQLAATMGSSNLLGRGPRTRPQTTLAGLDYTKSDSNGLD